MSLLKLTWDIRSQFLLFKDYYLNDDILFEFLLENLEESIVYPSNLLREGNEEEQMEFFNDRLSSIQTLIKLILEKSNSLKEFKEELDKNTSFEFFTTINSKENFYRDLLSNFIENI